MFQNQEHGDEIAHYLRVLHQLRDDELSRIRDKFAVYRGDCSTLPVHKMGRELIDRIDGMLAQHSAKSKVFAPAQSLFGKIGAFLKGHLLGIIIVAILCSLVASYIYEALHSSPPPARPKIKLIPADAPPTQGEPPIVTFIDEKEAVVNFSIVCRVLEADAPVLAAYGGDQKRAMEALEPQTKAAIFATFEKLTYDDASTRRRELEASLLDLLIPRYKAAGITLDAISLLKFRLIETK